MKNAKNCIKCKSEDIRKVGSSYGIRLGIWTESFSTHYICADCGYTEEWVEGEHLDKVRKKAKKKD